MILFILVVIGCVRLIQKEFPKFTCILCVGFWSGLIAAWFLNPSRPATFWDGFDIAVTHGLAGAAIALISESILDYIEAKTYDKHEKSGD